MLCSWLAVKREQVKRERAAAEAIEKMHGSVVWTKPSGPMWLRSLFWDDFFGHVEQATLAGNNDNTTPVFCDPDSIPSLVSHLGTFKQLTRLDLLLINANEAGLEDLKKLSQLKELALGGTNLTDEDVKKLQCALPNCRVYKTLVGGLP
jgi:hypothetical protein